MWSLKKQLIVTFVMFALREPKLNCWDILLTVHNSALCSCDCAVYTATVQNAMSV